MKITRYISSLVEYLLIFFIILDCNTPYAYALNRSYYITEGIVILTLILFILMIFSNKMSKNIFLKWLKVFSIYYIVIITYFFINVRAEKSISFITRFIIVIPLLTMILCVYYQNGEFFKLLKKFSFIIFILSSISLFFWILGSQLHILNSTGTMRAYWGYEFNYPSYYGLYFERQMDKFLWITGYRNIGIFCEGPMFSLCLVWALFVDLFIKESNKQKTLFKQNNKVYIRIRPSELIRRIRIIILSITLFTTTSTTGLIIYMFMFTMKYIFIKSKTKFTFILKILIGVIVICVATSLIITLFVNKSSSTSWLIRKDDFVIGLKAWLQSPLFGNGYSEWTTLQNLMNMSIRTNNGFSNSIFTVLSQGGIMLFSVYIVPIIGFIKVAIKTKDKRITMFLIIFLIEFIVTLYQYTFLMMLLLTIGYALIIINNNNFRINQLE